MVFAQEAGYPMLSLLWTMLLFFSWMLWIWLVFMVYADLFRRDDIGGWGKAGWVAFTLLLPYIGTFVYLVTQGRSMAERRADRFQEQREAMDNHIASVAARGGNGAGQLATAKSLLDAGALTPAEYEAMKQKVLA